MSGLGNLFGNKKAEEERAEQERIGKAMQSLSDQIAELQRTNMGKDKELDRLREELSEAQGKAGSASTDARDQLNKLRSSLAVAEADKQANEMMLQTAQKQIAELQAQLLDRRGHRVQDAGDTCGPLLRFADRHLGVGHVVLRGLFGHGALTVSRGAGAGSVMRSGRL